VPGPVAELGEGALWDAASESLYWIDAPAGLVHRLSGDGQQASYDAGRPVGCVASRSSGGLALASGDGFIALDTGTGEVGALAVAERGKPGNHMNDGACDRSGRFYAGSMAEDETPGHGTLYRLDPDRTVTELVPGVGISNGIGWSPDERLMYYVDSLAYRIDVFDYDQATGDIGGRRTLALLGRGDVMPDGLAVDEGGDIWVAVWGGSAVHRYTAAGRLAGELRLPAAHVTSCAFGGQGLDQLYITTAAGPGSGAGALFTCPAGVTGLPSHPYRG
jgi:sugar lactone lactonase YvrE